jgi:hypothetical protein
MEKGLERLGEPDRNQWVFFYSLFVIFLSNLSVTCSPLPPASRALIVLSLLHFSCFFFCTRSSSLLPSYLFFFFFALALRSIIAIYNRHYPVFCCFL